MTSPDPTQIPSTGNTCCGEDGPWSPPAGEPRSVACILCPRSGRDWYWRTNRADGRDYEPVQAPGDAESEHHVRVEG